jgi:hypothetical protein
MGVGHLEDLDLQTQTARGCRHCEVHMPSGWLLCISHSLMYYWHAIRPVGLLVILFKFEAKEAERTEK